MATEPQSSPAASDMPPAGAIYGGVITPSGTMPAEAKAAATDATDTTDGPPPGAIYGGPIQPQPQESNDQYPWSKAYPFSSSEPTSRLMRSFIEGSGLPADIKQWPDALKHLNYDPLTGKPVPHGHSPSILNAPTNIVKGIATGSAAASQRGLDQFNQPMASKWGVVDKAVGGLKYIIGGLPIAGPAIVKSMEEAEAGNYAGMFGTLGSMGMQALIANPEAAATRIDAAGKYLFSKPRVQETILAGEAKEMLTAAEAAAREKGHAKFPSSTATIPGSSVSNVASKAISDHIQGSPDTPGPLKSMMTDDSFKRVGAIERVGGGLQDIFARMASEDPVSMRDAHGYYTELGRYAERDLPGDVYAAVKQTRTDLGELIGDVYKHEVDPLTGKNLNKFPQWEDAKSYWSDLHKHWWDTDSPLYKAMNSQDPHETLQALLGPSGDTADRTSAYLRNYTNEGADPKIVKAASTLFKGMDQMRIRGLYQASGGLLLAMMLREFGVPTAANAATVGTLLGSRLARGYFNTRPSLTSLLSDEIKPSTWRSFPLKGGDANITGNPSPFNGGIGSPSAQPPPPAPSGNPVSSLPEPTVTLYRAQMPTSTQSNLPKWVRDDTEGKGALGATGKWFTESPSVAREYADRFVGPGAEIRSITVPKSQAEAARITNLPLNHEARKFSADPANEFFFDEKPSSSILSVDHSASTITPTESSFLSAISNHPSLHPDLAEDIKSITDPTRLKGIMDIMKYQKMGYNDATKIYDSINPAGPRIPSQAEQIAKKQSQPGGEFAREIRLSKMRMGDWDPTGEKQASVNKQLARERLKDEMMDPKTSDMMKKVIKDILDNSD